MDNKRLDRLFGQHAQTVTNRNALAEIVREVELLLNESFNITDHSRIQCNIKVGTSSTVQLSDKLWWLLRRTAATRVSPGGGKKNLCSQFAFDSKEATVTIWIIIMEDVRTFLHFGVLLSSVLFTIGAAGKFARFDNQNLIITQPCDSEEKHVKYVHLNP